MKYIILIIFFISKSLFSQTLIWEDEMTFESAKTLITPETIKGNSYKLIVNGQMSLNNINMEKDPAFMFYYGIHNDICWFWNWKKVLPTNNIYNPSHVYSYEFIGDGKSQIFSFIDDPYDDNSGEFYFRLYDLTPPRSLIAMYNSMGQKIKDPIYNDVMIYVYDNGDVEKIFITN